VSFPVVIICSYSQSNRRPPGLSWLAVDFTLKLEAVDRQLSAELRIEAHDRLPD
jgi:hypothetical protein